MTLDREQIAREMGRPGDGSLLRHPKDTFVFAEPWPMSPAVVRMFHGVIRAMVPTEPVIPDMEARIEGQVRRMMRYMNPFVATAFTVALRVLDWAPVWLLKKARRLQELTPDEASAIITQLAASKVGLIGDMVAGARAAVLAPYYDLEEMGRHIGWEPAPFMRERLRAVARIRAGGAAKDLRIGPFSAATGAVGKVAQRAFGARGAAAKIEGESA